MNIRSRAWKRQLGRLTGPNPTSRITPVDAATCTAIPKKMTANGAFVATSPNAPEPVRRRTSGDCRALAHAALIGVIALLCGACSGNGVLSQGPKDTPGAVAPVVAAGDYDRLIQHPGDAAIDASVAGTAFEPRSLDVAPPVKADLWHRARMLFALDSHDRPKVRREIDWFRRNQEYMDRVSDRARLYLYHIVTEVERRNMPGELALLPVVESAFQPFAYSPARASGIWQFIPSTGRHYGLRYSWWYDGRRDVVESTRAALDYLEKLHAEFSGDWLLALAAYNSGEGNVRKAIRRNQRAGKPTDFWSLKLPRETRSYVPRLLAVSAIIDAPAHYGLALKTIPDAPYFAATRLDGQIDLALAADLADVSLEQLYLLNPGFSRWATDPEGPHTLLLPVDSVDQFEERIAELPADERVRWHRHEIKSGDTLGTIAQRYRTSITALKQANNLRGTMIRQGHSLIVPVASRSLTDYRLSADMRRAMRRGVPGSGQKIVYRVRRGDSLWVISRRFGVSVNKLAAWNGLHKRAVLRPGKRLVIYRGRTQPRASKASSTSAAALPATRDAAGNAFHIVRRGDNLWTIARRYRLSARKLAEWNRLEWNAVLQPGQKLTLAPAAAAADSTVPPGEAERVPNSI